MPGISFSVTKPTGKVVSSTILLTATVATSLYSLKEANAQTNKTSAGGNKTENITSTNPLNNITIGTPQKITNNTAGGGNMTNATG